MDLWSYYYYWGREHDLLLEKAWLELKNSIKIFKCEVRIPASKRMQCNFLSFHISCWRCRQNWFPLVVHFNITTSQETEHLPVVLGTTVPDLDYRIGWGTLFLQKPVSFSSSSLLLRQLGSFPGVSFVEVGQLVSGLRKMAVLQAKALSPQGNTRGHSSAIDQAGCSGCILSS